MGCLHLARVRGQGRGSAPARWRTSASRHPSLYGEYKLKIGDSLRASIEQGLIGSRRAIVVISPDFFGKHWVRSSMDWPR
jgi:hypothetical protein